MTGLWGEYARAFTSAALHIPVHSILVVLTTEV